MKLFPYLKLAMFLLVFSGTVAFYVWYDKRSVIDSVLFVALTITTIGKITNQSSCSCEKSFFTAYCALVIVLGYENDEPSVASRLFTTFLMVFGILFIFTYIKDVLHAVARTIKNSIIPTLNLEHYVGAMLVVSLSLLVLTVFVGVMFVCYNEQLGFVTGLYFIVYTVTVRILFLFMLHSNTHIFHASSMLCAFKLHCFTLSTDGGLWRCSHKDLIHQDIPGVLRTHGADNRGFHLRCHHLAARTHCPQETDRGHLAGQNCFADHHGGF